MKAILILSYIFLVALTGCDYYETEEERLANDTIPPIIKLHGNENDTAYHFASYWEKGAMVLKWQGGELINTCIDAEQSGNLNTDVLGTYLLHYNATDAAGNNATTVTRTVHVIENSAAFLNGLYNVVSTCTVVAGPGLPVITTGNYVVAITTGLSNGRFVMNALKGDPADHIPLAYLKDNTIVLDYGHCQNTIGSGTVSAAKNSFTIETESVAGDTVTVMYRCKNVFVKP